MVSSSFSCAEIFRKANKHPFGKKNPKKQQTNNKPLFSLSDFLRLEFLSHTFSHSCCVFWSRFLSYWWFWEPKYSEICLVRLNRKQNFKGSWAPKPVLWVFCSFAWEGAVWSPKSNLGVPQWFQWFLDENKLIKCFFLMMVQIPSLFWESWDT